MHEGDLLGCPDRDSPVAGGLRRAARGEGLPATPSAVRPHVEGLMTDAAVAVLELERARIAVERRARALVPVAAVDPERAAELLALNDAGDELRARLEELRALCGEVRRRHAVGGVA